MPSPPPQTWVVIPAYEDPQALSACLGSLAASDGQPFRLLVVDDASRDGSVDALRAAHPECGVVVNAHNQGFAGTCNVGLGIALAAGARYVFLLNQDTLVEPDTLPRLVDFLERHPRAGLVGPKTYSFERAPDGRPKLLYAGSWQRPLLPLRQRIPGIEQSERSPARDAVQVDYVWGHGMLLRADALRRTGLFDTDFPMYYEDLDLCRRLRADGHELWCDPSAVLWHDQPDGARGGRSEYWRWACKVRGASVFYTKHFGPRRGALLAGLTHLADAAQLSRTGRPRAAVHLLRAALRHVAGCSDPLRAEGA